jgi:hypothetical protein
MNNDRLYLKKINKWRSNVILEIIVKIFASLFWYVTLRGGVSDWHYNILENIFTNTRTVFIDLDAKDIIINERNIKISIKQKNIKEIIILTYSMFGEIKYAIDIYDHDLNAYECFDTYYEKNAMEVAKKMTEIFKIIPKDKTNQIYYEGFKKE